MKADISTLNLCVKIEVEDENDKLVSLLQKVTGYDDVNAEDIDVYKRQYMMRFITFNLNNI